MTSANLNQQQSAAQEKQQPKAIWIGFNGTGMRNDCPGSMSQHIQTILVAKGYHTVLVEGVGSKKNPPGSQRGLWDWLTGARATKRFLNGATGYKSIFYRPFRWLTLNTGFYFGTGSDAQIDIALKRLQGSEIDPHDANILQEQVSDDVEQHKQLIAAAREHKIPIILWGYSRGAGMSAIREANKLFEEDPDLPVYLCLHDPNPGAGNHDRPDVVNIPPNVKRLVFTYSTGASGDRSTALERLLGKDPKQGKMYFKTPQGIGQFRFDSENTEITGVAVQGNHDASGKVPKDKNSEEYRCAETMFTMQAGLSEIVIEGNFVQSVELIRTDPSYQTVIAPSDANNGDSRILSGTNVSSHQPALSDPLPASLPALRRVGSTASLSRIEEIATQDIIDSESFNRIKTLESRLEEEGTPLTISQWHTVVKAYNYLRNIPTFLKDFDDAKIIRCLKEALGNPTPKLCGWSSNRNFDSWLLAQAIGEHALHKQISSIYGTWDRDANGRSLTWFELVELGSTLTEQSDDISDLNTWLLQQVELSSSPKMNLDHVNIAIKNLEYERDQTTPHIALSDTHGQLRNRANRLLREIRNKSIAQQNNPTDTFTALITQAVNLANNLRRSRENQHVPSHPLPTDLEQLADGVVTSYSTVLAGVVGIASGLLSIPFAILTLGAVPPIYVGRQAAEKTHGLITDNLTPANCRRHEQHSAFFTADTRESESDSSAVTSLTGADDANQISIIPAAPAQTTNSI